MKFFQLSDFKRGWLIGGFDPAIFKTKNFEFGVKIYKKGEKEETHMHLIASELTVIAAGKFRMNNKILNQGDMILVEPKDVADFECLESGTTAVIKIPSVKNDKYIISAKKDKNKSPHLWAGY